MSNSIINECLPPEQCCMSSDNKILLGCWDPTKCHACDPANNTVLRGDAADSFLRKTCRECGPDGKPRSTCQAGELCCGNNVCYNPACEKCIDPELGIKEEKCTSPLKCCPDVTNTSPCYDPRLCESCDSSNQISKGPEACKKLGPTYECCQNVGCYNTASCDECTNSSINYKCSPNESCILCGGVWQCVDKCQVCKNDEIVDILLASNKDPQCYTCENRGRSATVVPICKGAMKCCYGVCYDDDCSYCDKTYGSPTFGQIVDDCGPDKFCCQCQSYTNTYDPDKCCHPKKNEENGCTMFCDGSSGISGTVKTQNCNTSVNINGVLFNQGCCNDQCYVIDGCNECIKSTTVIGNSTITTYSVGINPGTNGNNACCIHPKKGPPGKPYNNNTQQCCNGVVLYKDDPNCCNGEPLSSLEICCNDKKLLASHYGCCAGKEYNKYREECCRDLYVVKKGDCCVKCQDPNECCGTDACIDLNNPCEGCVDDRNGSRRKVNDICTEKDDRSICCAYSGTSSNTSPRMYKCMDNRPDSCWICDPNYGPKLACTDQTNVINGTTECCKSNNSIECYNKECHECVGGEVQLKPNWQLCNNKCCPEDRGCHPTTGECCPPGTTACGDTCCDPKQCCANIFSPPAPGNDNNINSLNTDINILSSQCLSPGFFCCNGIPYSESEYKECCNGQPILHSEKCCTRANGSQFVCSSSESCCGDSCCDGTCCNNKDCCDVACCPGSLGGCFNSSACQECSNGTVINKSLGQSCCDGVGYNPLECEQCIAGVKTPFSPSKPNCYCYYGEEVCNCDKFPTGWVLSEGASPEHNGLVYGNGFMTPVSPTSNTFFYDGMPLVFVSSYCYTGHMSIYVTCNDGQRILTFSDTSYCNVPMPLPNSIIPIQNPCCPP